MTMVVTAKLLERGDIFEMNGGVKYKVRKLANNYVHVVKLDDETDWDEIYMESKELFWLLTDGDFQCPPHELKDYMDVLVPIGMYNVYSTKKRLS